MVDWDIVRRCLIPLLLALATTSTRAATMTVTRLSDDYQQGSLRYSIQQARDGDLVTFAPELKGQTIFVTRGELVVDRSVTILGPGPAQLALSGNGSSRVLNIHTNSTFRPTPLMVVVAGLTITGGHGADQSNTFDRVIGDGGAISSSATLTVSNCTLRGNATFPGFSGGAIYSRGNLTVVDSDLHGNLASRGGGIYNSGRLTVQNSTVRGNSAADAGGGIRNDGGTLALTNTVVTGNLNRGVYNSNGTALVSFCLFHANSDSGLVNYKGTVTVLNSTLSENSTTTVGGGGIRNSSGILTVRSSTLNGNSGPLGGGIANENGTLTLQNCTLSGNMADVGGGIWSGHGYTNVMLTIQQSTLSGNLAGEGGAIANEDYGQLSLLNSTVSENVSIGDNRNDPLMSPGASLYNAGTLTIGHTLVAGNAVGINFFSAVAAVSPVSLGHNLSDDRSFYFFGSNDLVIADAKLGPLTDNGGPTFTHALLPDSPAVDAGIDFIHYLSNSDLSNDQRGPGYPRVVGSAMDIGAFEYSSVAAPSFVLIQKVPAGLLLRIAGSPNEMLRVESNAGPGPASWQTAFTGRVDRSGILAGTLVNAGVTGNRFYRAVRP